MPKAVACPDLTQYQQLAAGQLAGREEEALLAHLEVCDACAGSLHCLPEEEPLANLFRQADTVGDAPFGEVVADLVERLSKLRLVGQTFLYARGGRRTNSQVCPTPSIESCTTSWPRRSTDELGRLGLYRVLGVLGAGGMGIVFRAEDPQLERLVALKAMRPALAASTSARQRFLREARAAAAIKHDHVVAVYQVGEDRGIPYLAMELLEGEPLDVRLRREGKLPLSEVLRLGREMALGLAAAHKRGLIHRDIKPANVWLEGEPGASATGGRVKILDFGLARPAGEEDCLTLQGITVGGGPGGCDQPFAFPDRLTQEGAVVGTPAYMAPEQGQGARVDHCSDLFSLGCVLWKMAAGTLPFLGTDATSAVRPLRELPPDLPAPLAELILALLARSPEERPESAQAVAESLERISGETQGGQKGVSAPRRRWRKALAAAVILALLLLPGFWLSGFVVRVETADGALLIQTDDASVAVQITAGGGAILKYGPDQREIQLKPGRYGIALVAPKAGLKLSTTQFTLISGEKKTVEVRWEKTAPVPAKAQAGEQGLLQPGAVFTGKRSYRKGQYLGVTVTYELHVRERDGAKFTGHVFDNGPGRNRAEVTGEIKGDVLTWREQGRFPELHLDVKGRLVGDRIGLTFEGHQVGGGTFTEGDGELMFHRDKK